MSTPVETSGHVADNSTSTAVNPLHGQPAQSKAKKKKKPGKKKATGTTEVPQERSATEDSQEGENNELSTEEQFQRQLDWCIEQLELGMRLQKATPKQREDASHALKTLRSSKAPLVKKRQVMRAMAGDYRKKMEEEKKKQFKLIQSELSSAQVRVKSASPQKSVFHRRAEVKQMHASKEQNEARDANSKTPPKTPAFVFTTSKEEFCFNFL
ncbi:UPF0488 protein C8orf33 homolog [Corythoichthys intestinalis]|uniref:UPF0488 protein C8orf33 homolog n=1 Tax=Corythoichthys intestinalis TaxID=161448 RepID=UPI0025A52F74|nr:UPF0488 protein C8orf33 homolog [Corythoichthys intestinalis]XP_061807732.1 UPF0488 protein C8orf33 homolog [Nerophis lumbriciformis]